jgi:hypothetical protein
MSNHYIFIFIQRDLYSGIPAATIIMTLKSSFELLVLLRNKERMSKRCNESIGRQYLFKFIYQAILHVRTKSEWKIPVWAFIWPSGSMRLLYPLSAVVCECSFFVWFTARMTALEKSWQMLSFDRYLCFLQPIFNFVGASCPIIPCRAEIP